MSQIVYVSAINTGEGKTLLTGLLLHYWRSRGLDARAIKPFAAGGTGDSRLLTRLQEDALPLSAVTPYRFPEAMTPLAAARKHRRRIPMSDVVDQIQQAKAACRVLLVEGAGGLLSPLGENYSLADLIQATGGKVLVAAKNRLGVLNQVRLTFHLLICPHGTGCKPGEIALVLMNPRRDNPVARSNPALLKELLGSSDLVTLPYLGPKAVDVQRIKKSSIKCKKTLARLSQFVNLPRFLEPETRARVKKKRCKKNEKTG